VARRDDQLVGVEAQEPLALDVGGVEVHRLALATEAVADLHPRREDLEQLVDAVDGELGVDRFAPTGRGLRVPAVHRRLLGHAPDPEPPVLVTRP
jgi:hypothetical protein